MEERQLCYTTLLRADQLQVFRQLFEGFRRRTVWKPLERYRTVQVGDTPRVMKEEVLRPRVDKKPQISPPSQHIDEYQACLLPWQQLPGQKIRQDYCKVVARALTPYALGPVMKDILLSAGFSSLKTKGDKQGRVHGLILLSSTISRSTRK